jgi:hypothetical protein
MMVGQPRGGICAINQGTSPRVSKSRCENARVMMTPIRWKTLQLKRTMFVVVSPALYSSEQMLEFL